MQKYTTVSQLNEIHQCEEYRKDPHGHSKVAIPGRTRYMGIPRGATFASYSHGAIDSGSVQFVRGEPYLFVRFGTYGSLLGEDVPDRTRNSGD